MQDMRLEWAIDDDGDVDDTEKDECLLELTIGLLDIPRDYHDIRHCLIKAMLQCLIERRYQRIRIKFGLGEQAAEEQAKQEEDPVTE
jgi:hypothetical protein